MTPEIMKKVYELRWNNKSIHDIAGELGVKYQTLDWNLKHVTEEYNLGRQSNRKNLAKPELPEEQLTKVFELLSEKQPIADIAEASNVAQEDIINIISYIAARKNNFKPSKTYPAISDWLNKTGQTQYWLAKQLNIPAANLSRFLSGKTAVLLDYKTADKFRQLTGTPFTEIYEAQLLKYGYTKESMQYAVSLLEKGMTTKDVKAKVADYKKEQDKKVKQTPSFIKPPQKRKVNLDEA